jgi:hypothetical protein
MDGDRRRFEARQSEFQLPVIEERPHLPQRRIGNPKSLHCGFVRRKRAAFPETSGDCDGLEPTSDTKQPSVTFTISSAAGPAPKSL